jgi:putative transposase
VRTFLTGYDADGGLVEWGARDMGRIVRLCAAYDRLQSKWSQEETRHRKRYRMRKAGLRIQEKIRHLVQDLHRKCAAWLCARYRVILLPVFETQQMVKRAARRIRSKTARAMMTLSHFSFRQHLLHKAREFPWCKVIIVTEEYTSKTCGSCGHLHTTLGGSKRFKCPKCTYTADRDANAARNILLKYLTEMHTSPY